MQCVLSRSQCRFCEKKSGVAEGDLIRRAGSAIAKELIMRFPRTSALVLCGPGNNGEDGKVVAELLKEHGWKVRVLIYPSGDGGERLCASDLRIDESIIIDALFGIGLSRPLAEDLCEIVNKINESGKFVISIDIPTGINCDTGEIMGAAVKANVTIALSCLKYGHVISPGRYHTGSVSVKDIGLPSYDAQVFLNSPKFWQHCIPKPDYRSHKYSRGYAAVYSLGVRSVGAVKLAALAALRSGAGAVAVGCSDQEIPIYASLLSSVMYKSYAEIESDKRVTSVLIGPGGEASDIMLRDTIQKVMHSTEIGYVLDAGAISVFQGDSKTLFDYVLGKRVVLTPHMGEFGRIFPELSGSSIELAKNAAELSNAVIVLKGHETIIASPYGKISISNNAPSALATIGSGDVLAGIIAGVLSARVSAFEASCLGVWVHGECGKKHKVGLIAEDIVEGIPGVMSSLSEQSCDRRC